MSIEELNRSKRVDEDRINKLKELFPEAFADGKLNIDILKEEIEGIDNELMDSNTEEFYGLQWVGKKESRKLSLAPPQGTLRFIEGDGVNEETTKNILIEGDNLEVLRILQKSYFNKIKMIYIDPPYNTGNDFIYNDEFKDSLEKYLEKTGQSDEEGLLTTNPKSNGRFHANWLNMMYPRLRLARNLLKDDGVIFVSIDDNEQANLKKIMDEIFGEENFVAVIPWQSRQSVQNDTDLSINHEYIVVYAKKRRHEHRRLKETNKDLWYKLNNFAFKPLPLDQSNFSNPDNDPRGPWKADPFDAPNIRPNLTYEIENPNTGEIFMPPTGRCWRTDKKNYEKLLEDNRIIFGKTGKTKPQLKVFYEEKKEFGSVENSWFSGDKVGTSTQGTREFQSLFDGKAYFDSPKPTKLLKKLIQLSTNDGDIILDFFAGSGSTGQAVIDLNKEEKTERSFILVQIAEEVKPNSLADKDGYSTILEITKERLRRFCKKINDESEREFGFRSFELSNSNFKKWINVETEDLQLLEDELNNMFNLSPFTKDSSEINIIIELMLIQGFPLDSKIENKDINSNSIWDVSHEDVPFSLVICLDDKLHKEAEDYLNVNFVNDTLVCIDEALTNEQKIKLCEKMNIKTI